jgi:misacylated tRNA(Ala) deacylase
VPPGFKDRLTEALNAEVQADRAIEVRVLPREEAYALGPIIKTATDLLPPELEVIRLIDVTGLDLQADGGTHVASTRQIGRIEVTKVENKGRGFRRVRIRLP